EIRVCDVEKLRKSPIVSTRSFEAVSHHVANLLASDVARHEGFVNHRPERITPNHHAIEQRLPGSGWNLGGGHFDRSDKRRRPTDLVGEIGECERPTLHSN